jgi:hypothetical protein
MWIREKGKIVVVEGDLGYNGAKVGIRLMEGRKRLLTPQVEGRWTKEDRVKGKSGGESGIFVILAVLSMVIFCGRVSGKGGVSLFQGFWLG